MVALLGTPPKALLDAGKSSHEFFTEQGKRKVDNEMSLCLLLTPATARPTGECRAEAPRPNSTSLEMRETSLEGESREKFLAMMRKMLQWEPAKRASAKELAEDEWIMEHM